jgi:hypothetical protein
MVTLGQDYPLRTIIPHRLQRCLGFDPFPRNVLWLFERNTKRPRRTVGTLDHFFAGLVGLRASFFGRGFADGLAFLVWYLIIFNSLDSHPCRLSIHTHQFRIPWLYLFADVVLVIS